MMEQLELDLGSPKPTITYTYWRHHSKYEDSFDHSDHAFNVALADYDDNQAMPVDIRVNGTVVWGEEDGFDRYDHDFLPTVQQRVKALV